jgi:hypothetical protein
MSMSNGGVASLIAGSAAVSVHLWASADTFSAGTFDNNIFSIKNNGFTPAIYVAIDGATPKRFKLGGASVSGDGLQSRNATTTTIATGTWYALGGVLDYGADTISPYVNGAVENSGVATFANATLTLGAPGVDAIGSNGVPSGCSACQWDGQIAHVAVWNVALTAQDFAALGAGVNPWLVKPENLVVYWPFWGSSPEVDLKSNVSATITGTIPVAADPPSVSGLGSRGLLGVGF